MKKIKFTLFAFVFILLNVFAFQRCGNGLEIDLLDIQEEPGDALSQFTDINFSVHCENTFDYVGVYHNTGLGEVLDKYALLPKVKSQLESKELVIGLVSDFLNQKPLFKDIEISDSSKVSFLHAMIDIPQTKSAESPIFSNEQQQKFYDEVKSVFSKGNANTLQELVDDINKLEKHIMESNLSDLEKTQLLVSTSVAKYSSVFWSEYFMKTAPAVRTKSFSSENDALAWWKNNVMPNASIIIGDDFEGAAQGAVEGLVFGSLLTSPTGPGAIGGAISGALVGGATGAVVSSTWSGIELIFTLF